MVSGTKREFVENGWLGFLKNYDFWRARFNAFGNSDCGFNERRARHDNRRFDILLGKQATEGRLHDALGWLVYVAALGLLILLNFVLQFFFRKIFAAK